jgi:formylglycine-generating enzyme required for sulfatase activity
MLLQRAGTGTIPPPDFTPPNWTSLAEIWDVAPKQVSPTITLGPAVVSLGHDDFEADDMDPVKAVKVDGHEFGWDNESPKRDAYVKEFSIEWRPITNGQFYNFYKNGGQEKVKLPASWVEYKGETHVCLQSAVRVLTKS